MEVLWRSLWLLLLGFTLISTTLQGVQSEQESNGPSELECRVHIEKALKQLETGDDEHEIHLTEENIAESLPTAEALLQDLNELAEEYEQTETHSNESIENEKSEEVETFEIREETTTEDNDADQEEISNETEEQKESEETTSHEKDESAVVEETEDQQKNILEDDSQEQSSVENVEDIYDITNSQEEDKEQEKQVDTLSKEDHESIEDIVIDTNKISEDDETIDKKDASVEDTNNVEEDVLKSEKDTSEQSDQKSQEDDEVKYINDYDSESEEEDSNIETYDAYEQAEIYGKVIEQVVESEEINTDENEQIDVENVNEESTEGGSEEDVKTEATEGGNEEDVKTEATEGGSEEEIKTESVESGSEEEIKTESTEGVSEEDIKTEATAESISEEGVKEAEEEHQKIEDEDKSHQHDSEENIANVVKNIYTRDLDKQDSTQTAVSTEEISEEDKNEGTVVEELVKESEDDILARRPRDHIEQLLKLDDESTKIETIEDSTSAVVLNDLKKLYENAIKPLENLYKYRDLSNRHFGDSEIFSKPLILFMGPWSGGKSTIINYLLNIEYNETALHTGAEPSPAHFNILMYGEEPEILEGTKLAADYTFSGLQKFGQGLEERLRGYKLPSKLLKKVNIVEIPGILEIRKQVSRVFPFNDACQWFIDRADIIFLIYDPSKLDVGPETEAILDQLKGREHQTRIVLNKADQVKPEELMRVQGALIWNISPLMSSAQPPIMYTTSLWSKPYEPWAPVRFLQAQEQAFLKDFRSAVDKRIDNKIASARRFAVRVRNHAKMVDCYLTTYYNHKSVFGNRKQVSDEIINHPQDYHIYEGLSTLTNISRYDLPDPDVYKDFFRLNALYDFQQLSATCTYFRGCPINRLDVAIAYDLPELIGKHKHLLENALSKASSVPTS